MAHPIRPGKTTVMSDHVIAVDSTVSDVSEFDSLSPEVRLEIAAQSGYLDNEFEESLRTSERHERADQRSRVSAENKAIAWNTGQFSSTDLADADLDYHPPAPTCDRTGRPLRPRCFDCMANPKTVRLRCRFCNHKRNRRTSPGR